MVKYYMKIFRIIILGVFTSLAFTALAQDDTEYQVPLSLSVEKILTDPWRYHDKKVQITGTFDECASYTCQLCDGAEISTHDGEDKNFCFGVSFLDKAMERLARFSTITVEGKYDANCAGVAPYKAVNNAHNNEDDFIVCTDRATQLYNTYITEFSIKRSPAQGYISSYGDTPLLLTTKSQAEHLIADFKSVLPSYSAVDDVEIYHTYLFEMVEDDSFQTGGVCLCNTYEEEFCEKPTREGDTYFESAAKNYSCYPAEYRNGTWVFSPFR